MSIFALIAAGIAQTVTTLWASYFLNDAAIGGIALATDSSDNKYLCGSLGANGMVLKVDQYGALQWAKTYTDGVYAAVAVDSGGNAICVSQTGAIVKYSAAGAVVWKLSYGVAGGVPTVQLNAVAIDSSDNIYVTGRDSANAACVTAMFDSSGVNQWQRKYRPVTRGAPGPGNGRCVVVDSSGVYVSLVSPGDTASYLLKYDLSGSLQAQQTITNTNGEAIALDGSSNVYYVASDPRGGLQILQFNSSLVAQLVSGFGTLAPDLENSDSGYAGIKPPVACAFAGGNLYVSCRHHSGSTRYAFIAKLDSGLNEQWQRSLTSANYIGGSGIAVNGSIFNIAGDTDGNTGLIASLPTDGTHQKTRGVWTYASTSLGGASAVTVSSTSGSDSAASASVNTGTGTAGSFSPTSTRVFM